MQKDLFNNDMPAKPFLKWAGGKKQLIKEIESRLPQEIKDSKKIDKYFEPFVGGGAVYFYLMANYKVKKSYLYDVNKELILTYNVIKFNPKELIEELKRLSEEYLPKKNDKRSEFFYNIRNSFNENLKTFDFENYDESHAKRAAQIIFLNKTCFNGLFRVNRNGEFNVPFGRYKNPKILDKDNIISVSKVLKDTEIVCSSYEKSKKLIDENSLVYLDPPYRPLSNTSYFNNYSEFAFNDHEQIKLSEFYKEISLKGAKVIMSNSDPKNENKDDNFFDDIYNDFNIDRVLAKRSINANGKNRGNISELIIYNYDIWIKNLYIVLYS